LIGRDIPKVHLRLKPTLVVLTMGLFAFGVWFWLLGFRPINPFRKKAPAAPAPLSNLPPIILWAWEQPEDLTFLDPARFGVAYLAKTCTLTGDDVSVRPRLQPLKVPDGTVVIAVVRIETDPRDKPAYTDQQAERLISEISGAARARGVSGIQVDFDAKSSERAFYRNVLVHLKSSLPAREPLSITALASWCYGDDWISSLPVDEAIPMLFRMGVDSSNVRRSLESRTDFKAAAALHSLGISTDEILPWIPPGRRVYIFSPKPWTELSVQKALDQIRTMN
jgi:hypothetical protein